MKTKSIAAATLFAAASLLNSSCHTTGSVLGATIGDLDDPFAVLDLSFDT